MFITLNKAKQQYIKPIVLGFVICSLFIVLAWKNGVYPFGNNAFIFVSDGYNQNLATLYYIWDCLHGEKSFLYSFSSGFGMNMMGILSHFGMLSPINVLYFFIPREYIIESTVFTTLLRFLLSGYSMDYFIKKIAKNGIHFPFELFTVLLYVYSSWAISYIYFFQWIDEAILLPLLVSFLIEILDLKLSKGWVYSLILALVLVINIQSGYGILLYILLFSVLYMLFTHRDGTSKRKSIIYLGFYTMVAVLLSTPILLPSIYQIVSSRRYGDKGFIEKVTEIFDSCISPDITYRAEKFTIFKSSLVPILLVFMGLLLRRLRKQKIDKALLGSLLLNVIVILPIFVEAVHYIWQGGTYVCFPLRVGEVLIFTSLYTLVILFNSLNTEKRGILNSLVSIEIIGFVLLYSSFYYSGISVGDYQNDQDAYHYSSELHHEYTGSNIRYKNVAFMDNESVISGLPSWSNYLHLIPDEVIKTNDALGYYQNWTALSDKGGTPLTDALLGYEYILDNQNGVCISPIKTKYPFGLFMNGNINFITNITEMGLFNIQNILSNEFINESLFEILVDKCDDKDLSFIADGQPIYINLRGGYPDGDTIPIVINDKIFEYIDGIMCIGEPTGLINVSIPANFEGTFSAASFNQKDFITKLPESVTSNLSYGLRSLQFDVNNINHSEQLLFIPLTNSKGLNCKVNGKRQPIHTVCGCFSGITIPANS